MLSPPEVVMSVSISGRVCVEERVKMRVAEGYIDSVEDECVRIGEGDVSEGKRSVQKRREKRGRKRKKKKKKRRDEVKEKRQIKVLLNLG